MSPTLRGEVGDLGEPLKKKKLGEVSVALISA